MPIICWKSCYEIGVGTFDAEHHNLVASINALHEAMREKKGDDILYGLLGQLITYTKKHFLHEEEQMDKYQYPLKQEHIAEHCYLKKTIIDFQEQVSSGYTGLSADVLRFLRDWLLNHITETDMKFGKFLRDHSIYDCGPPHI